MISKDKLFFDPTDADTILASDSVGAFVRSADGTLIPHKSIASSEWLQVASALFDGDGNKVTSTGNALDVNIKTSDIQIDVDLTHTEDSVRLGDGTNYFTSTSENSDVALDVHVSNSSIAVTATNLDIRDLTHVSDSVKLGDGTSLFTSTTVGADIGLDVNLINASIAVTATNLDIRDLSAASDSVASWTKDGSGNSIGSHTGALDVYVANSLTVNDAALANTAINNAAVSVGTSEAALPSSALANRKYLIVQNLGNKPLYLGKTGVSSSNGLRISPNAVAEFRLGAAVALYGISTAAAQDIRVLELS